MKKINKIFTKKFLEDLNIFLSTGAASDEWTELKERVNETNLKELEINNLIILSIMKLPALENIISENRNFGEQKENNVQNYFFKYSNNASNFMKSDFRIDKFQMDCLNDPKETKWFDNFAEVWDKNFKNDINIQKEFENFKNIYDFFATYTVTSLNNHNYMISNYSRESKEAVCYLRNEVEKKFDNKYKEGEIIPIRGFARYNHYDKKDFVDFILSVYKATNNTLYIQIMIVLASVFMKGEEMAIEAEYRFLILQIKESKKNKKYININIRPNKCLKFKCDLNDENPFYKNSKEDLELNESFDLFDFKKKYKCDDKNCWK